LAPAIIRLRGERVASVLGLLCAGVTLFLLGDVGDVARLVDPVNPVRLVAVFGADLSEKLRTAALLAVPIAFGVALTATAVQTLINRREPLGYQGRTFAMQSTLRNGTAIVPLLALGLAATEFGVEPVLLVTPLLLLAVGYSLVALSFRYSGLAPYSRLQVMESFWEEPPPAPP